ncbi:MAG TPA: PAS domain S-box protein [Bryobacteraceae bacterium]
MTGSAQTISALVAGGCLTDSVFREMVDALPVAIYTTDAEGRLTYFNKAAVKLSGRVPELGTDQWCVTWKIFLPDGAPLPHDQCPMALALKGQDVPTGIECIAERPDGTRFWFLPCPAVLRDDEGRIVGGMNLLIDITDRKVSERDTWLLSAIVDSSDDAIISKGLDGVITSWNKSAERLFGFSSEEAIGKTVAELLIPADRQDEEPNILDRLRRGERVDHFETVRRRKDGSLLDISLTISPVRDANGRIIGASKIARDISGQKRADRAIQALNAQLATDLAAMKRLQRISTRMMEAKNVPRLLDEILAAGIEITGADMGNIQLLEDGVLKIAAQRGFEPPFLEFFNSVHGGDTACGMALELRERVIVEDVASSPIFAGTPGLAVMLGAGVLSVQATPLVTRDGQLLGVFSTHYRTLRRPADRDLRLLDVLARQTADLIERKRAETALLASEARFRQLADAMPQIVWTARPDGYVDYHNERWYEFTGSNRTVFGDSSWEPILHPEDLQPTREIYYSSIHSGQPYNIEYRLWDLREERFRWFIGRALPVRDGQGRIVKWFGTCTDIDEQKRVQDELRRINQDLEQFAYSASHDLQEPLRSVKIYTELLAKRYGDELNDEAQKFMGFVRGGATRMETLVRDLLAYTRVTSIDQPMESADAAEALKSALSNLGVAISEAGAKVIAESLPRVPVHATHLQQLFQNLIGNAIKYRSPDRPPVVHITATRQKAHWLFAIRDNGIGIDPKYRETIFGLFKRLHTTEEYSGTGIGLALCQRIVNRYQGRIWVESEPGQGSTFRFTLPV